MFTGDSVLKYLHEHKFESPGGRNPITVLDESLFTFENFFAIIEISGIPQNRKLGFRREFNHF